MRPSTANRAPAGLVETWKGTVSWARKAGSKRSSPKQSNWIDCETFVTHIKSAVAPECFSYLSEAGAEGLLDSVEALEEEPESDEDGLEEEFPSEDLDSLEPLLDEPLDSPSLLDEPAGFDPDLA